MCLYVIMILPCSAYIYCCRGTELGGSLAELAKAKKQRQQAAKQEAIATGTHQLKAIGKGRKVGRGNGKVRQKKR